MPWISVRGHPVFIDDKKGGDAGGGGGGGAGGGHGLKHAVDHVRQALEAAHGAASLRPLGGTGFAVSNANHDATHAALAGAGWQAHAPEAGAVFKATGAFVHPQFPTTEIQVSAGDGRGGVKEGEHRVLAYKRGAAVARTRRALGGP